MALVRAVELVQLAEEQKWHLSVVLGLAEAADLVVLNVALRTGRGSVWRRTVNCF